MIQLYKMAWRDLGRNRRRTFFSMLALAVGLGLLIFIASFIAGEYRGAMQTSIKLQSGHLLRVLSLTKQGRILGITREHLKKA